MELNIVDLDAFVRRLCSAGLGRCSLVGCARGCTLHQKLIIDAELALRHAREEGFDADAAQDVRLENSTAR